MIRIFVSASKLVAALAFIGALYLIPAHAHATESEDIVVGIKTLPMLTDELTGPSSLAIIYDQTNPESKADAESIKAALDNGIKSQGGVMITGVMMPLNDLSKLGQSKLAYIAKGVKSFDEIAQAANAHNVLTMSSDVECVKANKCILGITSKPVVEIYFSRAASQAANVGFDSAFIMLVKKV